MPSEKSHLLSSKGTLSATAIGYMNSILKKRYLERENTPRGLLGILTTITAVFKNTNLFFFQ